MPLSESRWKSITPSAYAWERDALEFIRERLPDLDPYRAWANFEFLADDGTINEVDLLILTPAGFFLVEIKSWPGLLKGDVATWVIEHEGRVYSHDNPLMLANRKAKKLASLLRRQKAAKETKVPYIEPLVFLSHEEMRCFLQDAARTRVTVRDRENASAAYPPGIIGALTKRAFDGAGDTPRVRIDRPVAKAIALAMEQSGVRESNRSRRVGDYLLKDLLFDAPNGMYQDWRAEHVQTKEPRRIRIYTINRTASDEARETARRAANREYQILSALIHPAMPQVETPIQHDLGTALLFRTKKGSVRLDHFLAERGESISIDVRLALVRQIAEAMKYAHEKKIVHRSLSPQSILVSGFDKEKDPLQIQIFNWQTGYREGSGSPGASRVTATRHLEDLIEKTSMSYVAPEALSEADAAGEKLDIFSLGAIAYHVFSGKPPAMSSLELLDKIRSGPGLQLSSVLDGAAESLQELVQLSTHPDTLLRPDSVDEWLKLLDNVEEELTAPSEDDVVSNPLDARSGEKLPHGYIVRRRLGKGSSATAFLVEKAGREGRETVLKLANGPEKNDRIRAESATIQDLSHPNIAEWYENVEMKGLAGFTMEYAGERDTRKDEPKRDDLAASLADRIKKEGALQLELLERFGEDLLKAVVYLELKGVAHRDIKPENIGIGPGTKRERLHLILFDFSLSRAPLSEIHAGTPPYLDPFLPDRPKRMWDSYAERYAAAMTLYEMTAGTLPKFDGNPSAMRTEVPIEPERFDASLRDRFKDFFGRAFARDVKQRFDNAETMLAAWRELFKGVEEPALPTITREDISAAIAAATLQTPVLEFGLSTRAANALDRLAIRTSHDLLSYPIFRIHRQRGVGTKTRKEIVDLLTRLHERFPDVRQELEPVAEPEARVFDDESEPEVGSIDAIAGQLTGRPRDQVKVERKIQIQLLGLDLANPKTPFAWKTQSDIARERSVSRANISASVVKGRDRWKKNPSIRSVRNEMVDLLNASGGVLTIREAALALLVSRGSSAPEPVRSQIASAVVRAAVETESAMSDPRFLERRDGTRVLISRLPDLGDLADRLGRAADKLAAEESLASPARVVETLRSIYTNRNIALPPGVQPMTDTRLSRLAVEASMNARLSSKGEIYPKEMDAVRAINLASGALYGAKYLTVEDVKSRVASRYPDAAPLPARPQLDQLLADLNLSLKWSDETQRYEYIRTDLQTVLSPSSASTSLPPEAFEPESPQRVDAKLFEQRLEHAVRDGGFLVLITKPKKIAFAERKLAERFGFEPRNVDRIVIESLREEARENEVDWDLVVRADGAAPQSTDRNKLAVLVSRSVPRILKKMAETRTPLFAWPGLLARYDRMDVIETLRDQAGAKNSPVHTALLLIAADDQSTKPIIDDKPVPVMSSSQWARIPDVWLEDLAEGTK